MNINRQRRRALRRAGQRLVQSDLVALFGVQPPPSPVLADEPAEDPVVWQTNEAWDYHRGDVSRWRYYQVEAAWREHHGYDCWSKSEEIETAWFERDLYLREQAQSKAEAWEAYQVAA